MLKVFWDSGVWEIGGRAAVSGFGCGGGLVMGVRVRFENFPSRKKTNTTPSCAPCRGLVALGLAELGELAKAPLTLWNVSTVHGPHLFKQAHFQRHAFQLQLNFSARLKIYSPQP